MKNKDLQIQNIEQLKLNRCTLIRIVAVIRMIVEFPILHLLLIK